MPKKSTGKIQRHNTYADALAKDIRRRVSSALTPAAERLGQEIGSGQTKVQLPGQARIKVGLITGKHKAVKGAIVHTSRLPAEALGLEEQERREMHMVRIVSEVKWS